MPARCSVLVPPSASAAAACRRGQRELGQDLLTIEPNDFGLIGLRGLHKDMGDAASNQLLQRLDVHLRVVTDQPLTHHVLQWSILLGLALNAARGSGSLR